MSPSRLEYCCLIASYARMGGCLGQGGMGEESARNTFQFNVDEAVFPEIRFKLPVPTGVDRV